MLDYLFIVFESTHDAIKAEDIVRAIQIDVRLIPTPGSIVAGCGFALRANASDKRQIEQVFQQKKINYQALYLLQKNEYELKYIKIT